MQTQKEVDHVVDVLKGIIAGYAICLPWLVILAVLELTR